MGVKAIDAINCVINLAYTAKGQPEDTGGWGSGRCLLDFTEPLTDEERDSQRETWRM